MVIKHKMSVQHYMGMPNNKKIKLYGTNQFLIKFEKGRRSEKPGI